MCQIVSEQVRLCQIVSECVKTGQDVSLFVRPNYTKEFVYFESFCSLILVFSFNSSTLVVV